MSSARFLLFLFSVSVSAQVVTPTNCVYREGDDPAWSRPDYDDRGWSTRGPKVAPLELSEIPTTRMLWMRCRVTLPPSNTTPLYLQIRSQSAWTAFFDGVKTGSEGDPKNGAVTTQMPSFPLPGATTASADTPHLIALRVVRGIVGALPSSIAIGSPAALRLLRDDAIEAAIGEIWFSSLMAPFFLSGGLILLLLSGADPDRREIFWFGILLAGTGLFRMAIAAVAFQTPGWGLITLLSIVANPASPAAPWFFYSLRRKPVPNFYRVAGIVGAISFIFFGAIFWIPGDTAFRLFTLTYATIPARAINQSLLILLWTSVVPAFWPWWKLRGEAWITFFAGLLWASANWITLLIRLPVIGPKLGVPVTFTRELSAAAALPSILTLTVLLALRFRRIRSERDDLSGEMNAARNVQRRLVPETAPSIPGFHLDVAYFPAKEVGGDFYRFVPADDGSLLVVVGDVSGKGLDAAMIVSAAIGALGHPPSREPSVILAHLNESLLGQTGGGFVTCCAALFRADGKIEIANAGHIPPYLEGREIDVEPGPPLGLIPGLSYESTTIKTREALTFVSDGVVEAENAKRELFGFDRTREISGQSARGIADAAKAWGQNDDITVVTVRRTA